MREGSRQAKHDSPWGVEKNALDQKDALDQTIYTQSAGEGRRENGGVGKKWERGKGWRQLPKLQVNNIQFWDTCNMATNEVEGGDNPPRNTQRNWGREERECGRSGMDMIF